MGWARYAHSMRVFVFNSGLFYLQPTAASVALLDAVAHRVATENGWDQALFNEVGSAIQQASAVWRDQLKLQSKICRSMGRLIHLLF